MKSEEKTTDIRYFHILFWVSAILAVFFRVYNLWEGDFQGDEVAAFGYLFEREYSFFEYLLAQLKGPGQYLITKLIFMLANESYYFEFWMRLPFTLAAIASIFIAYLLAKKVFGYKAAVLALFFIGLSGHLISYSRMVQNQPYIMLTGTLSMYFIASFLQDGTKNRVFWAGLISGIGILFHYNACSYILPVIIVLFWYKHRAELARYLFGIFLVCAPFYTAYILNPHITETINYLFNDRINSYFHLDSLFHGIQLGFVYHPKEYLLLILVGLLAYYWITFRKNRVNIALLSIFLVSALYRYTVQISKKRLYLFSSLIFGLFTVNYLYRQRKASRKEQAVILINIWFMVTFLFYMLFITKPLGSVFTMEIPMAIIAAVGILYLYQRIPKLIGASIILVMISCVSFYYQAHINTNNAYPFDSIRYAFGPMYQKIAEGERFRSINGFMYKRNLRVAKRELRELSQIHDVSGFTSNEKNKTMQWYGYNINISDKTAYFYVHVKNSRDGPPQQKFVNSPLVNNEYYSIYLIE